MLMRLHSNETGKPVKFVLSGKQEGFGDMPMQAPCHTYP